MDDADIFYDMMVSTIKEVRLIMDYLEDVHKDSDMKFNLIGYSLGGGISLLLNSIDDRINSVVACVPPLGRPYTELEDLDWKKEIGEKMKAISPLYVATNQKSPVALLMGKTDFFIPEKEARTFYNEISIDDKKLKFYDSGHELPDAYIEDVINWITQHNKK
jgi:esterase/lipase